MAPKATINSKVKVKSALKSNGNKKAASSKVTEPQPAKKLKRAAPEDEESEEPEQESASEEDESLSEREDESDEGDNEADSESDEDSGDEYDLVAESEQQKQPNKKRKQDSEAFSKAITAILGSKIKAHDVKDPILVRSKKSGKDLEEKKLEAKAKHALMVERRQTMDKDRVRNIFPKDEAKLHDYLEHEKLLRKTAQKGVVKLFNAILASQKNTQTTLGAQKQGKLVNVVNKETATNMSKEQFLDLIRSG